jgi:formate hydrogenlyase subunit 3/multisubunit Na+/H+ antiporter MnhD subunit
MTAFLIRYLMSATGLSLVAGLPLAMMAGCGVRYLRVACFRLLPWATVPAILVALFVRSDVEVLVPWFFMGGAMGLDATGRVFLGLTGWVWLLASFSFREKLKQDPHRYRAAGFFLASMSGNFGLILAEDVLGFYLFFALMSFSAYGLIVHRRTEQARKAGRVYLLLVFLSELAMFTALVLLPVRGAFPAGGDFAASAFPLMLVTLLFISFGVKIGALPFHSWMILSYQQAPIPAATALAGAMLNAGIIGWLRFFPFGGLAMPGAAMFFVIMGASATLYGVIFGLYQEKGGRVLASSSISQMGLVTMAAGLGFLSGNAGQAAASLLVLYAVHHSLAKTSLFLGYDLVDRGGRISAAVLLTGLLIPSLSLSGLPLTSGAMIKGSLKELAALGGHSWYLFGKFFLPISSMGTTLLMLHFVRLLRLHSSTARGGGKKLAALLWVTSVVLVAAVPWLWPAMHGPAAHSLQVQALMQALWPVAAGTLLALGWFAAGSWLPGKTLDVEDFDYLVHRLYAKVMQVLGVLTGAFTRAASHFRPEELRQRFPLLFSRSRGPSKWEKVMRRWSVVGLCYLVISLLLFLFMLLGRAAA